MLDLESAIKHCEEVAEELEKRVKPYQCESINKKLYEVNKKEWDDCLECAKDHHQLAEWLKELKIHRKIHDVLLQLLVDSDLDICCEDLTNNEEEQKICEENCDNKTKGCWVRWAKLKAREVNTDES